MKRSQQSNIFLKTTDVGWAGIVKEVNTNSKLVPTLYNMLRKRFLNLNTDIDEETLFLSTCLLENNNILFHNRISYKYFRDISSEIFKRFDIVKRFNNRRLFYRFCFAGVYSDYFISNQTINNQESDQKNKQKNEERKAEKERKKLEILYKKSLTDGLRYFSSKHKKMNSYQTLVDYLLSLIHMSQHYLFKGNLAKNHFFLNKALNLLKNNRSLNKNYKAFFYYHYAWSLFEMHDYKKALLAINKLLSIKSNDISEPIVLHAMNIKCAMLYALKKYDACFSLASIVSENSKKVFSASNLDVYAESLLNVAKCLIKKNTDLQKAKHFARKAISILKKLFLNQNIDISQALANIVLGDVYELLGKKIEALSYFKIARKIYESSYQDKVSDNKGYLNLIEKIQNLNISN